MALPRDLKMQSLRRELGAMLPPDMPRPVPPVADPVFQAWRSEFQAYVDRKDSLVKALNILEGGHEVA
ncbi:MAG: hypothetical protein Q8K67_11185 [Geothrix sp.]|nr:hypothetical protein [Geothrix sp.]